MAFFNKLPHYIRYPSQLEWRLLKKIPVVAMLGTLVILLPVIQIHWQTGEWFPLEQRTSLLVLGLLFTFWFFVGVVSIGLTVVIIMKGPGYIADGYQLPKENPQLENKPHSKNTTSN